MNSRDLPFAIISQHKAPGRIRVRVEFLRKFGTKYDGAIEHMKDNSRSVGICR
jgi:hypothetical protein